LIAAASFGQREVVQRLLQALRLDRRLLLKTTGG
jgi:MoxR-like ATPase